MDVKDIFDFLKSLHLEYRVVGKGNFALNGVCALNQLHNESLTWIRNPDMEKITGIEQYHNMCVILPETKLPNTIHNIYIFVENPHSAFFEIVNSFFAKRQEKGQYIENDSVVLSSCIGKNVSVGHHCYIGKDVILGDDVVIEHNVILEGSVEIGARSTIESGVVIGLCGFGHYKDTHNVFRRIPHLGGVIIGEDVYIGANSTVARGTIANTIIEDHVKIDARCHIAHNDIIKRGVMITGGVGIAGSVTVEEDAWIGPNSTINNGLIIGRNSFVGIASVVTKNVPEGKAVFGVPARILKDNTPNVYTT